MNEARNEGEAREKRPTRWRDSRDPDAPLQSNQSPMSRTTRSKWFLIKSSTESVADPIALTIGRRGTSGLCILEKPYNLGGRVSDLVKPGICEGASIFMYTMATLLSPILPMPSTISPPSVLSSPARSRTHRPTSQFHLPTLITLLEILLLTPYVPLSQDVVKCCLPLLSIDMELYS
ncbi:hypothetical protein Trydic_g14404 [Trypoxylus dichotomus]